MFSNMNLIKTKSPKFMAIRGSGRILGKSKIMHLICYAEAKLQKKTKFLAQIHPPSKTLTILALTKIK